MIIAVPLQSVHPLDNPVVLGKILEPLVQKCKALKKQMDIENSVNQAGTALADTVGKLAVSAKKEPVTEEIAGSEHTEQSEKANTANYSSVAVDTNSIEKTPKEEKPKEDSLTTKKFNATVQFANKLATILFQNVSSEDLARSLTFQRLLTLMKSSDSSDDETAIKDDKTTVEPQAKLDHINQLFANSFPFAVFDRRIGGIESKELTATAELLANIRILVRKAVISQENLLDTMSTDDASENESKNTKSVDAKKSELKTSEQYNDRYMDVLQRLYQRLNALEQDKATYAEYLNKTEISEAITAKQNAINALKEKICSLSAYATPLAFYATIALWEADYYVDSSNPSDKKTNRELMGEHVAIAGPEIDPRSSSISQSVKSIKNDVKAVSLNSNTLSMLDTLKMDLLEQSYINGHISSPQREKLTQASKEGIGNTALYELHDSEEKKSEEFEQVLTDIVSVHPIPAIDFSEKIIKFIGQDEQNMQGYHTSLSIRDSRYSESIKKHTHNTSTRLSLSSKLQHVQAKTEALQTIENEITKIFSTEKDSRATINAQILAANTLFLTLPASISVHQQSLLEESAIFQEYADLTGTEKQLKALRNKINSYRLLNPIASENGTKTDVTSLRTFGVERNDMYIDTLHRLHQRVYALRQEQAKRSPADTKLAQHDSAIGAIGVIENKITALNSLITEIQKLATVTPPTPLNFYVAILLWEKDNKASDFDISKPRKPTTSRWGGMFQTPTTLSMLDSLKQDLLKQAVANEDMRYSESLVLRKAIGRGAEEEIDELQLLATDVKKGAENDINDDTNIVASSPAVLNSRNSPLLFSFNRTGTESTAPDLSTVDKVKKGWQTTQTTAVALKNASAKAYGVTKERITRPRNADGTVLSDDLKSRSPVLMNVINKLQETNTLEASRTRSRSRS